MSGENKAPALWDLVWKYVFEPYGVLGLVLFALLVAGFLVWSRWSTVSGWPGVSPLVARSKRKRFPKVDPHGFSVAGAHLEDDDAGRSHEKLIIGLLHDFKGVQVLAVDRTIPVHGSVPEERERKGHGTARRYLKTSKASVLIWGRVLRHGNQSKPSLYLTAAAGHNGRSRQYTPETGTEFSFPDIFWDDLADVLRLVIATQAAQFEEGHYVANRLEPFIARVRTLLEANAARPGWNADARASAEFFLAKALRTLGEQAGQAEHLKEAVKFYRVALEEWSREREPLKWAGTQTNLGVALLRLGEREAGTVYLEEAVEVFRAALEEFTRERVPLDWAMVQTSLGASFLRLGEREAGTARLEEAVEAFRAALEEFTRERVPLQWAATQSNLGTALASLGEREAGTARLEEAVEAFRAALRERTRERVPLQWARTQNNLGNTLAILSERKASMARLEEAVEAYRAALEEYTRERVPLDWAMVQNNLGTALQSLGERDSGTARLEEAVEAYRAALEEYTRERVPLQWAGVQTNLGNTLQTLGERETGTAALEAAVEAFRAALKDWTRERVPLQWATTQNNLGLALATLGERKGQPYLLKEALEAIRSVREVYMDAGMAHLEAGLADRIEALDAAIAALESS